MVFSLITIIVTFFVSFPLAWIFMKKELVNKSERLSNETKDRIKAEQELQRQNDFITTIIESIPHPFLVIGVKNYDVVLTNSAARKKYGLMPEGMKCYQYSRKTEIRCGVTGLCPLDTLMKTKQPVVVNQDSTDYEGNASTIELHAHPILDDKGEITKMIEISFEKMEKESFFKTKNEELERLNRLMVGRERKMVELKQKIKQLKERLSK